MDFLQRLLFSFVGTASVVFFLMKYALGHWTRRGILHEKPKIPWGHLKGVGRKRHVAEVLQTLYNKYKGQAPFIGFFTWLKPMLLLLDINSINNIINKDATYFMDRGLYYNIQDDVLSQNQLQMDGIDWQHTSMKLKALQWQEQLHRILPALWEIQEIFQSSLEAKFQKTETAYNVSELIEGFNIDCISSLAFGLKGDSLRSNVKSQFHRMCKSYMKKNFNIYKAYLAFVFPSLARLLQYHLYSKEVTQYFSNLIADELHKREYQHLQPSTHYDLLQLWSDSRKITQSNQIFKKMNNQEIAGQAFSYILAGLEATNTTLVCCLYELALQPHIQEKARNEVNQFWNNYKGKCTEEELNKLVYLKQIINETFRKHSPYPFLLRLTTKDYELPGSVFLLRQGNHLIIPTVAIHQDAAFYENPDKFDPEHFHSTKVQSRPACAFLPFGLGPRSCMAKFLVEKQMLVCLLTLLRQFEFAPCATTTIPLSYDNAKLYRKPNHDVMLLMKKL